MRETTSEHDSITNLEELFNRVDEATQDSDQASLGMIVTAFGSRGFAPLLLLAGVVTLAPIIGDIPGVPTLMAVVVFLVAVQMVVHPQHLWLPNWLLNRSVSKDKVSKAVQRLRRPARFVDRLIRPRLTFMVGKPGCQAIAATCLLIALMMPPMEFVPFSANGAGIALTAFGLALIAHDGLLALLAFSFTGIAIALVLNTLL